MDAENRVNSMSVDDMRDLIKRISKAQPSFLLNILDNSNVGNGQPAGPAEPEPPKPDQPSWCSNCREMPIQHERLCCKRQPLNCHSRISSNVFWMNLFWSWQSGTGMIFWQSLKMTITTGVIAMLPTGSISYGYMDIWGPATGGLYRAVVFGELGISIPMELASMLDLLVADLAK
ncbi:unnamed protein product [Mytilus coruscus]|uniref:Uncharacterized protein n=1 Tax=Mytilus coruscus TaxID=42192 RepID=A0A6J8ELN3_MYTCO|nr:unnamed protein product [Mytilus coruscus]